MSALNTLTVANAPRIRRNVIHVRNVIGERKIAPHLFVQHAGVTIGTQKSVNSRLGAPFVRDRIGVRIALETLGM